ncbi:hypothetical protein D3C84_477410 [compost metagenome]
MITGRFETVVAQVSILDTALATAGKVVLEHVRPVFIHGSAGLQSGLAELGAASHRGHIGVVPGGIHQQAAANAEGEVAVRRGELHTATTLLDCNDVACACALACLCSLSLRFDGVQSLLKHSDTLGKILFASLRHLNARC